MNKYYQLKELSPIVNLSYRQLLARIKEVALKYDDRKELLYKKSNKWYIHYSLIKTEFKRIREPIDYKWFVTINAKNQLEIKYWKIVIFQLNKELKRIEKSNKIKYVIEKTRNGINHLHFMTSYNNYNTLIKLIKKNDLTCNSNEMNTNIQSIYDKKRLEYYFRKQNKPVLLR